MAHEGVLTVLDRWETTGKMTHQMAEVIDSHFDELMAQKLKEVEALVETKPEGALALLGRLTSFVNTGITLRGSILKGLETWVQRLRNIASALGGKLGANGYSIGIGLPVGVSISLSFPISY